MAVILLWVSVLAFFGGVALQSFVLVPVFLLGLLFSVGIVALALSYRTRAHVEAFVLVGVLFIGCSLGVFRMSLAELPLDRDVLRLTGSKVTIEGTVVAEPDVRDSSIRVPIEISALQGQPYSMDARVLAVVPLHTEVSYGDTVEAEGVLHPPTVFETTGGRVFNYPQFLAKEGIGYELSFAKLQVLAASERSNPFSYAIALKQWFLMGLALALPEPAAGLAGGITLGDKRGLGPELSETFRIVGLTHIVVLSGYNIMIVLNAVMKWGGRLPVVFRMVLGGLVALFFAAITGFAAASVRAALMAMVAMVGKISGREYIAGRILLVIAFLMVLWNPYVLAFDPGFQLSILATAGLIGLTPLFAQRLTWITEKLGLREVVAATLGTQAAVLPLLLFQNGQLPVYSLLANILALIVIPYAMLMSAFAAIGGIILGPLAPIIGFPAYLMLEYVIGVARLIATLPFAAASIPAFSVWILMLLYMGVGAYVWMKKKSGGPEGSAA